MRTIAGLPLIPRLGYALGFLACAGLIGFALYLQYYENQDPCPLCLLQRIVFIVLMVLFLAAAVHGPGRVGAMIHGGLQFAVAAAGANGATVGECWNAALRHYVEAQRLADLKPVEGEWYPASIFFQGMKFMLFGDPSLRLGK